MKRKYGVMIATWILWFISILVPLFCVVLKRVPQRFLTVQFLVILLLGILLCVQWIWLRRAERLQNTAIRGEIEGAGMAALQSMTVPVILAMRTGEILWCNEIFRSRFAASRSVQGRSVQDVIHLNLAALDQNRDLLMEHNGLSYRVHAVSSVRDQQEIIAVQFLEITDILRLQHEQTNSRPCVLLLVIDSYDDLLQYARESEKAQVSAEVERVLEDFMQGTDGVIRKVENDLFYAVMESRHLHEIMNNRFHVLDARYGSTTGCTLPFPSASATVPLRWRKAKSLPVSRWIWHWDEAATRRQSRRKTDSVSLAAHPRAWRKSPRPRYAPLPSPCRNSSRIPTRYF